jgi:hypothetical protein
MSMGFNGATSSMKESASPVVSSSGEGKAVAEARQ